MNVVRDIGLLCRGSTTWWTYALLYIVRNDNKASALTSQVRESVIVYDGFDGLLTPTHLRERRNSTTNIHFDYASHGNAVMK